MTGHSPTPALRKFARRLRKERQQAGMSQRNVAKKASSYRDHFGRPITITGAYVSRLETADRFPSVDVVFALADAIGVDRLYLLTGKLPSA